MISNLMIVIRIKLLLVQSEETVVISFYWENICDLNNEIEMSLHLFIKIV